MNSYNENLRTSVVVSLQSQELEEKKLKAKMQASMYTLYYAQGATITAHQQLHEADGELKFEAAVKAQTVAGNDIATNLLYAQNHASDYLKQSVTNTAVAASNVQIAATAILKLASDMGSIFSIVNAADFDTDIYKQAKSAMEYMNSTAYTAEVASQLAMEASMLAAESSFPVVLDNAKSTGSLMGNLLKVVSTDYDNADQTIADDNAALATANGSEKQAEGVLEDNSVDYRASVDAYEATNKGLNLDLKAFAGEKISLHESKGPFTIIKPFTLPNEDSKFTVQFNFLKSPFPPPDPSPYYPVKFRLPIPEIESPLASGLGRSGYNIILVKDTEKTTFSLPVAESLISAYEQDTSTKRCFIPVDLPEHQEASFQTAIPIFDGNNGGPVYDSDGNNLIIGTSYVIFLMAILRDDYKKMLNTFDDYLSAPSAPFNLTINLQAASDIVSTAPDSLSFSVFVDNPDLQIEQRFMLLPVLRQKEKAMPGLPAKGKSIADLQVEQGLLTTDRLGKMDNEMKELQKIFDDYDPRIAAAEQVVIDLIPEATANLPEPYNNLSGRLTNKYNAVLAAAYPLLTRQLKTGQDLQREHDGLKKENPDRAALKKQIKETHAGNSKLKDALAYLKKLVDEKHQAIMDVQKDMNSQSTGAEKLSFFFNLELAENVSASNYCIADVDSEQPDGFKVYKVYFGPAAAGSNNESRLLTDCFGNMLVNDNGYLPVVLSVADEPEEKAGQFTNALSDMSKTETIVYQEL